MKRALPLAALALAWGAAAAADTPPCLSSARVEPEQAWVGQQLESGRPTLSLPWTRTACSSRPPVGRDIKLLDDGG